MTDENSDFAVPENESLRTRIAAAIVAALDSDEASESGYGSEFVRDEGDGILKLDGEFNGFVVADAVIRELGLEPERRVGPGEPGEGLSGFIRYTSRWEVDD